MKKKSLIIFAITLLFSCSESVEKNQKKTASDISFHTPNKLEISGLLGKSLNLSKEGRLKNFITGPESKAIRIFHADTAKNSKLDSWKGEHAGKWLYAASKAAYRSQDEKLKNNVLAVADFLVDQQNEKGYIGTYRNEIRFYSDTIEPRQRWDVWITAYLMQGLLEVYKYWPEEKYLEAVKKLGNLCIETFQVKGKSLVNSGCFSGMASAGIMENFVDLYILTQEEKYLSFAEFCALELENRPGVEMITRLTKGYDVSEIGEGKMYEMLRCIVGFAKLFSATGDSMYYHVAKHAWQSVHDHHLAPYGAPWGGIHQHKECFNIGYMFSPYGYSETCAMMDWFRLNKELFIITGNIMFAEELEKTAYNGVPGAQFPDGLTWTYHSHPNGKRTDCGEFACCSSSGTIVLEEIPEIVYSYIDEGISINIFTDSRAEMEIKNTPVEIIQVTEYPFDEKIGVNINTDKAIEFPIYIRIPEWADKASIVVNKKTMENVVPGEYYKIIHVWEGKSQVDIVFPMCLKIVEKSREYNYRGEYIDGKTDFFYLKRGPVVYTSNLKDGLKAPTKKTFNSNKVLGALEESYFDGIPVFEYKNLDFKPYYMACERKKGNYKATWLKKSN